MEQRSDKPLRNPPGSRSSWRGKKADDPFGRGLTQVKPLVWRQLGEAPPDDAAIPELPPFRSFRDRLALLLKQCMTIPVAATGAWIPVMSECGRGANDQHS